jgi:hypothetical protein
VAIEPSAISRRPSTKPPSQRGARRLRRLALTRKNTDTTDLQPAPFSSNHWSEEPRHVKAPRSRPPYGNFARGLTEGALSGLALGSRRRFAPHHRKKWRSRKAPPPLLSS